MPNPNIFVDSISSISPSREALVATPLKPPPQTITINFQSGRSSLLDMSIHRSVVWAEIIDSRCREDKPIYVEIDAESNTITKLLLPRAVRVGKISSNNPEIMRYKSFNRCMLIYRLLLLFF